MQHYRMSPATYEMVMKGLVGQRVPMVLELSDAVDVGTIYIEEIGVEPKERDSETVGDDGGRRDSPA